MIWLDDSGHDPAVLADLAVTDEPELLVGRQGTVEEEAGGHRTGVLRVSLDSPAAQGRDEIERTGEGRGGHALAPVPLTDVAARDPPVWRGRLAFFVRRAVLDPGHLAGRAELAPPHAVVPVVYEGGVRPALSHPALLGRTVVLWVRSGVIVMEAHAPAAAEDAVVALHQRGERGPRRLIQGSDGVRRLHHDVQRNPGPGQEPPRPGLRCCTSPSGTAATRALGAEVTGACPFQRPGMLAWNPPFARGVRLSAV